MIWKPLDVAFLWICNLSWFRRRLAGLRSVWEDLVRADERSKEIVGLRKVYGVPDMHAFQFDAGHVEGMNLDYIEYKNRWQYTTLSPEAQRGDERAVFWSSKRRRND